MDKTTPARSFRPFFTTNFWPAIAKLAPYIGNRTVTPPRALFNSSQLPGGAPVGDGWATTRLMWNRFRETLRRVEREDSARSHNCITIWVLEELKRLMRLGDDRVLPQFDQIYLLFNEWWNNEGETKGLLEVTQANSARTQGEIDFVNNHCKVSPATEAPNVSEPPLESRDDEPVYLGSFHTLGAGIRARHSFEDGLGQMCVSADTTSRVSGRSFRSPPA